MLTPEQQAQRDELLQWVKEYRRAERDRKIRAGRARPKTQREMQMYLNRKER